jgi:hypothetical protein
MRLHFTLRVTAVALVLALSSCRQGPAGSPSAGVVPCLSVGKPVPGHDWRGVATSEFPLPAGIDAFRVNIDAGMNEKGEIAIPIHACGAVNVRSAAGRIDSAGNGDYSLIFSVADTPILPDPTEWSAKPPPEPQFHAIDQNQLLPGTRVDVDFPQGAHAAITFRGSLDLVRLLMNAKEHPLVFTATPPGALVFACEISECRELPSVLGKAPKTLRDVALAASIRPRKTKIGRCGPYRASGSSRADHYEDKYQGLADVEVIEARSGKVVTKKTFKEDGGDCPPHIPVVEGAGGYIGGSVPWDEIKKWLKPFGEHGSQEPLHSGVTARP